MNEPSPTDGALAFDRFPSAFQDQLSAIVGFCDLLLGELPEGDPSRADVPETHKALRAAVELFPRLSRKTR